MCSLPVPTSGVPSLPWPPRRVFWIIFFCPAGVFPLRTHAVLAAQAAKSKEQLAGALAQQQAEVEELRQKAAALDRQKVEAEVSSMRLQLALLPSSGNASHALPHPAMHRRAPLLTQLPLSCRTRLRRRSRI